MEREAGVLEVTLHSNGGPFQYGHGGGANPQEEFASAFTDIGADRANLVVILAGTGDQFSGPAASEKTFPVGDVQLWDGIREGGIRLLMNLLDIPVPIISCINGPALRHAEIPLLADIVLASDTAVIQDTAHFTSGTVPGDGMNYVLPLLLGYNRGRHMLLTGRALSASEAHDLGLVAEVWPREQLRDRARALAKQLATRNPLVLRYTRMLFTHPLKKALHELLGYGLALESLAAVDESIKRRQDGA